MYLLALQQNNGIGQLCYQSELQLDDVEPLSLTDILDYQGTESLFPQLLERYYLRNAVSGVQPKVSISNIT
ncbi:MAG: phosphatidylinositol kinase, partial [Idiomarinaceae bacterium]|nr:phosphatidylinositol kinase [Idiomarinaceae bacterium]